MSLNKGKNPAGAREIRAQSRNFHAAFTLIELLVVLAIVVILVGMITPPSHAPREKVHRIKCMNDLKNLGIAFRIYATDNHDRFPWEIPNQKDEIHINYLSDPSDYIRGLSNEISTPKILICPADTRKEATNWSQFSRTTLSYFISPDASQTFSNSFLAGDRNITNNLGALRPGLNTLSTNGPAGWDKTNHKYQGNACMGDGSVQQLSSARFREQLRNTGQTNKDIKLSVP
jgi:prepilin-type N-terminal cleavage/methylation domain-containing protein